MKNKSVWTIDQNDSKEISYWKWRVRRLESLLALISVSAILIIFAFVMIYVFID